jgi:FtsH-binding integral membrane protein
MEEAVGETRMDVTRKLYILLVITVVATAGVFLANPYWHNYDAFLVSYSVLWLCMISGLALVVSGNYRTNRQKQYIRNVIISLGALLVVALFFAVLLTVVLSMRGGLAFVAVAGATLIGIVAIKIDAMRVDRHESGTAVSCRASPL